MYVCMDGCIDECMCVCIMYMSMYAGESQDGAKLVCGDGVQRVGSIKIDFLQ